jgi:hypothetical protein
MTAPRVIAIASPALPLASIIPPRAAPRASPASCAGWRPLFVDGRRFDGR